MKQLLSVIICVIIFYQSGTAFSIPEPQKQYAGRCILAILNCHYDTALAVTDSAMAADSLDPLAPLLRLTVIGIRDVDFDTLLDSADFFCTYQNAEKRISSHEKTKGPSSYSKMLLGFCKGIHSSFYLREKSYFAAMRNGLKAISLLDESHRLDSTNVEPFFLLGLYNYAKGELKRRLWWVLFWYPGSKKEGIDLLWRCNANGYLSAEASLLALAEIYTRENKQDECAAVVERLERDLPASRFTLWAKARYFESRRLFYEAGQVYELLAVSYASEQAGKFNMILTRNLQAHMLLRSGQRKDAADSCRAILRETASKRNKVIINDTKKLLRRINDGETE